MFEKINKGMIGWNFHVPRACWMWNRLQITFHMFSPSESVLLKWFFAVHGFVCSTPFRSICVLTLKHTKNLNFHATCRKTSSFPRKLAKTSRISQIYSNASLDLIIYYHLRCLAKNLNFNSTFGDDKCLGSPTQIAK